MLPGGEIAAVRTEESQPQDTREFPEHLLAAVPYTIHTILTENGIQFAEQPRNRDSVTFRKMPALNTWIQGESQQVLSQPITAGQRRRTREVCPCGQSERIQTKRSSSRKYTIQVTGRLP